VSERFSGTSSPWSSWIKGHQTSCCRRNYYVTMITLNFLTWEARNLCVTNGCSVNPNIRRHIALVVVSECRRKCSNAPSLGSPVVDEERTRPGHWLGQCIVFPSVLKWNCLWHDGKDIRPIKNCASSHRFCSGTVVGRKLSQIHPESGHWNEGRRSSRDPSTTAEPHVTCVWIFCGGMRKKLWLVRVHVV